LLSCLDRPEGARSVRNICFKSAGEVIINPPRPLIENLDELPFPKKDCYYRAGAFRSTLHIISSRGCPHACSYCVQSFYKRRFHREFDRQAPFVRKRSPANVIEEIKLRLGQYPIDHVLFCEEVFVTHKSWLREFLEMYKTEIGAMPFSFSFHSRFIDEEVARWLAHAGAVFGAGALETANNQLRRNVLKRNESDDQILNAVRLLRQQKIQVNLMAIFGIPRETEADRWQTVDLVERSGAEIISTFLMYPYPGTEILEIALSEGYLDEAGLEQVKYGLSSYHQRSLLKNVDAAGSETIAKLLPLYIRVPRLLKPLIRRMMKMRIPRLAHLIYVATSPYVYFAGFSRNWISDALRRFVPEKRASHEATIS
jgi:anaerobic magnesium-protoporphyrin IX monomethyl ester cyclase